MSRVPDCPSSVDFMLAVEGCDGEATPDKIVEIVMAMTNGYVANLNQHLADARRAHQEAKTEHSAVITDLLAKVNATTSEKLVLTSAGKVARADGKELVIVEDPAAKTAAEEERRIVAAFKLFDKDNSQAIDASEFQAAAYKLGEVMTIEEARKVLADLDEDGSGGVTLDEFKAWWRKEGRTTSDSSRKLQALKVKLAASVYKRQGAQVVSAAASKTKAAKAATPRASASTPTAATPSASGSSNSGALVSASGHPSLTSTIRVGNILGVGSTDKVVAKVEVIKRPPTNGADWAFVLALKESASEEATAAAVAAFQALFDALQSCLQVAEAHLFPPATVAVAVVNGKRCITISSAIDDVNTYPTEFELDALLEAIEVAGDIELDQVALIGEFAPSPSAGPDVKPAFLLRSIVEVAPSALTIGRELGDDILDEFDFPTEFAGAIQKFRSANLELVLKAPTPDAVPSAGGGGGGGGGAGASPFGDEPSPFGDEPSPFGAEASPFGDASPFGGGGDDDDANSAAGMGDSGAILSMVKLVLESLQDKPYEKLRGILTTFIPMGVEMFASEASDIPDEESLEVFNVLVARLKALYPHLHDSIEGIETFSAGIGALGVKFSLTNLTFSAFLPQPSEVGLA